MKNINTSVGIHPHDAPMTIGLHPMPELHTTTLKIYFNDSSLQGVNIFLPMTPEEVIAFIESQVEAMKEAITETNAILDDPEAMDAIAEAQEDIENNELIDFKEKFDSSPMGQVINSIFNITGK